MNFLISVEPEIPFDVILANTIDIFREEPCMRYYGAAYLKMLQDNVLKEKNNLVTIPLQSWTGKGIFPTPVN